jgi:hypothetical protein
MGSVIHRNNFDSVWLVPGAKKVIYTKFIHTPIREKSGVRGSIKSALREAVVDHHKHLRVVAKLLKKHGFKKASGILSSQLPRSSNTRMGNFGEVVSSEHLRQRYGYAMPVFKLRYMDNFLMPMRGEDILCFELNQKARILSICLGEAKTLGKYQTSAAVAAHDRLANAFNPFPVCLSLIANVLYDRDENELADQIEDIIASLPSKAFPLKNWIFIVSGDEHQNPFEVVEKQSTVVKNLSCVDIYLPDLQEFVKEIFDSPLSRTTR